MTLKKQGSRLKNQGRGAGDGKCTPPEPPGGPATWAHVLQVSLGSECLRSQKASLPCATSWSPCLLTYGILTFTLKKKIRVLWSYITVGLILTY